MPSPSFLKGRPFMKFLSALIVALVLSSSVQAGTRQSELNAQFLLNKAAPGSLQKSRLGDRAVNETLHTLRAKYDFAVQGGATGAVTLLDVSTGQAAVLPKGAIVRDCIIDVITPATTSAAGTLALSTGKSAADLRTATAAASVTGLLACVPVGTAATAIKMTADSTMVGDIATGALTAGKLYVIIQYELSDTL